MDEQHIADEQDVESEVPAAMGNAEPEAAPEAQEPAEKAPKKKMDGASKLMCGIVALCLAITAGVGLAGGLPGIPGADQADEPAQQNPVTPEPDDSPSSGSSANRGSTIPNYITFNGYRYKKVVSAPVSQVTVGEQLGVDDEYGMAVYLYVPVMPTTDADADAAGSVAKGQAEGDAAAAPGDAAEPDATGEAEGAEEPAQSVSSEGTTAVDGAAGVTVILLETDSGYIRYRLLDD